MNEQEVIAKLGDIINRYARGEIKKSKNDPVVLKGLYRIINEWEESQHPRDVRGRFTRISVNISKEDYLNPQRDYVLPDIPVHILEKLNKKNKPVVLKKNIIKKNKLHHPEVNIEEYNDILTTGIYQSDIVIKTSNEDDYYNFIAFGKNDSPQVLVELSEYKNNYEIVNFYKLNSKRINQKIERALKRVSNEDGEFLITDRINPKGAARLSALERNSNIIITGNSGNYNPDSKETLKEDLYK